jgi:hypothetical protein
MENFKTVLLVYLVVATFTHLTGCSNSGGGGSGGGSSSAPSTGSTDQGSNTGTNTPIDNSATWSKVEQDSKALADGGNYNGKLMIRVDSKREALILTLPLPPTFTVVLPNSSQAVSNDLPGVSVETAFIGEQENWSVVIPLKYVLGNVGFNSVLALPNGNPLPFLPAGEINGFSLSFPQQPDFRVHVYLAVNAAAAFIETPNWKTDWGVGVYVKNQSKTRVMGYFSIVPNKGTYSSGVYLASRLPTELAQAIGQLTGF